MVVELAHAAETELDPRASLLPESANRTPAEFVVEYLAKDARERELSATRLAIAVLVVGVLVQTVTALHSARAGAPLAISTILAAFLAYEIAVHLAMRRGWFHPRVPLLNTCVEVSIGFPIALALCFVNPRDVVTSPWHIFQGGLVVFFAVRAAPTLCLVAGALAALEYLTTYAFASRLSGEDASAGAAGLRAVLFLACGVGGATLARHFVRRAAAALREIREQDMFGRYLLGECLGRGGMGEVYRATYCPEGGFVRTVAVKKMRGEHMDDPDFAEAFKREACIAAALVHPNIIQVIDCGRFRGDLVFVMEYVDGVSLANLLRARPKLLSPAAVAYLGAEIASALAYLHGRMDDDGNPLDLVHCDVNPPNVLLSRAGEVKLADFGVVRARGKHEGFGGKLSYSAPEQLEGRAIDARTDLFALGLTLYEALVGKPVFAAGSNALLAEVPALPESVPPPLRDVLCRLVALEPDKRPPSAVEVHAALVALTGELAPSPNGRAALVCAITDLAPKSRALPSRRLRSAM